MRADHPRRVVTAEVCRELGYDLTRRHVLGDDGSKAWFVAPAGTPPNVQYGKPYASLDEALSEVLSRVAHRLGTDAATVRQHLEMVLARRQEVAT